MKKTPIKLIFGLAVFAVASVAFAGTALAIEPTVQTLSASQVDEDSARMNGRLNPEGRSTTFWFEYGTNTNLSEDTTEQFAGSFDAEISVSHTIHGLQADRTYFFRLVAENSSGISRGQIRSFTTDDDGFSSGDAPVVDTGAAQATGSHVVLNGDVDTNASWAEVWFRYGQSPGSLSNDTPILIILGNSSGSFTRTISNSQLVRGRTYHYQAVARNDFDTDHGQIRSFVASGGEIGGGGGQNTQAPSVITDSATVLGQTSALLQARVDPNGTLSSAWFEFGRTTALTGVTTRDPAGSGDFMSPYSVTLTGLSSGTTYHYRAVSQNVHGTVRGQILSFRTAGTPVKPVTPGGGAPAPAPTDPEPPTPSGAPGCFNVTPAISSPQLKASQDFSYSITYHNICGHALSDASLTLTLPPAMDFAGTNFPFLSRDGNVITYEIGDIADSFQATVTVNGVVKERVETGDTLAFQADIEFSDPRGTTQTANAHITAGILNDPVVETNGTSTLGASIADTLSGLFYSGWFWMVLFLILIALFVFWMATRKRADEEEDEDMPHEA
jgi:hypothetical protein